MRVVKRLEEIRETSPCSLALGTFDGIHGGHREVLKRTGVPSGETQGDFSGETSLEPAVFTFEKSPLGNPAVLTSEDKRQLLEKAGVRRLYSLEFSQVKDMDPEEFVREALFSRCRAKRLCCGEDFRFGRGAKGDVALLRQLCPELHMELSVAPPVLDGGEKVSSTRIRGAVEAGEIPLANQLLGRPFGFSLPVIHGNHLGTGLGTPTLNQALPQDFVRPKFGVYASWALTEGRFFYGVTNIGVKPTVGSDRVLAETWLPEYSGNLYGKEVRLFLICFIRPERKFPSLEALKEEILKNAGEAKKAADKAGPPTEAAKLFSGG